jgi:urea transport system ATP-binding protein
MSQDIIFLENVVVDFNGFKALNGVNFFMDRGELRFLIGPNGAGKTTLLDVICRKVKPASGNLFFDSDQKIDRQSIYAVARLGISRKFQSPSIFPELSVWENMELASPRHRTVWSSLFKKETKSEESELEESLEKVGLLDRRTTRAGYLSHGQKQWLEIAMTLAQKPKLLMVDEPVAGMTGLERHKTGELLALIAESISVLVVEHDMDFVRTFSKTVTVLHEGKVLCEGDFKKVSTDPRVVEVYLGRGGKK